MTRRTKRFTLTIILCIVVCAIALGGVYVSSIVKELQGLQKEGESSPFHNIEHIDQEQTIEPPVWEGDEVVNILIMGVDARGMKEGEIPRSDAMLVASLDPEAKKISLFSLMRDSYVEIPGYNNNRINTAITHGPNVAMQAASDLLGIPVQYYVYTDFQGFIKLVDALGGVDFEVEKDLYYVSKADNHQYDIDLKQGMQHLDGEKALMYVRFRHDAMSDFARTERQRELLKAIADKMLTSSSIAKLPSILNEINPYIDTNLSLNDIWKLASLGYQSTLQGSEQIPPMSLLKEERIGGAAVLTVRDEEELKSYVQDVLKPADAQTEEVPENRIDDNDMSLEESSEKVTY
ncbi:transcriptional regulator [Paenibacillus sp. FSL H7-0326]|uniref:LCP family protein n=1 Tax=Paenibacillus sp. FSL H7-0326 TaxID=1921144 RepID=UPI00096D5E64|nr:LCP family protein [Paenibacillus sp. FSL H7-0326]OMC65405.1 transcriptional regulator [Paenibacillus sp. FSL H7-0326]